MQPDIHSAYWYAAANHMAPGLDAPHYSTWIYSEPKVKVVFSVFTAVAMPSSQN